jgi:hypothetical protein
MKEVNVEVDGKVSKVASRHGYGIRQFDDGSQYEGDWTDNIPNG